MSDKTQLSNVRNETNADRLRRTTSTEVIGVSLVSALAGDREMTEVENDLIKKLKQDRGNIFYSDLFYTISHHYFAPKIAENLWNKVLSHKQVMSEQLGRNVSITVATLDYLSVKTSELKSITLISEEYVSEIANLSMRDGMTGLFNHTSCYELLELEFRSQRRYAEGLSLILLDVDDFKLINDQYGHQEGDRILIELAKILTDQVRDSDICCRFGGEEFVAILPFTKDTAEAIRIAERIRKYASKINCGDKRVTISVGVAICDHTVTSPVELVEKADQAMYKAKENGKNQVFMSIFNDKKN